MTAVTRAIDAAVATTQASMFGPDDATTRAALQAVRAVGELVEQRLIDEVRHQRRMGATWQEIGDALGTTRQSAHERFGKTSANVGAGDEEMGME